MNPIGTGWNNIQSSRTLQIYEETQLRKDNSHDCFSSVVILDPLYRFYKSVKLLVHTYSLKTLILN